MNNTEKSDNTQRMNKKMVIILIIIGVLLGSLYFVGSHFRDKDDGGGSTPHTSITQPDNNTEDNESDSGVPATRETIPEDETPSGDTDNNAEYYAPDDPRRTPATLTAPTTVRAQGNMREAPSLNDPRQGTPDSLAKNFLNRTMSLCIRQDTGYNKNFREKYKFLATERMIRNGFGDWADTHSLSWKVLSNEQSCNSLIAFPELQNENVVAEDTISYQVDINLRARSKNSRGMIIPQNLPPIQGIIYMKYVDDKWLVDQFSLRDNVIPAMR